MGIFTKKPTKYENMSLNAIEAEIAKLKGIAESVRNISSKPINNANGLINTFKNQLNLIRTSDAKIIDVASKIPDFVRNNLDDLSKVEAQIAVLTQAIVEAKSQRERLDGSVERALNATSDAASSIYRLITAQLDE
jgi:hypothetical protein